MLNYQNGFLYFSPGILRFSTTPAATSYCQSVTSNVCNSKEWSIAFLEMIWAPTLIILIGTWRTSSILVHPYHHISGYCQPTHSSIWTVLAELMWQWVNTCFLHVSTKIANVYMKSVTVFVVQGSYKLDLWQTWRLHDAVYESLLLLVTWKQNLVRRNKVSSWV